MALPSDRASFKQFILRNLGKTVLQINVSDEQVEDQIDLALQYFADYHFDGTQRHYYKFPITANLHSDALYNIQLISGGTGYSNTDTLVFGAPTVGSNTATGSLVTYANGTIASVTLDHNGSNYSAPPAITINTSTGSGASITSQMGGFVELPENIIGISRVFPFHFLTTSNDMFSVEYQFALHNLYTIANSALVPFYMAKQHLQLFQEVLIGKPSFRFNRNVNRLYIDVMNQRLQVGEYMVVETYMVIDPTEYPQVWKDRFLIRYATALVKKQWGQNLSKFGGGMMPGGIQFNGRAILEDAMQEIKDLETEMLHSWSPACLDVMG